MRFSQSIHHCTSRSQLTAPVGQKRCIQLQSTPHIQLSELAKNSMSDGLAKEERSYRTPFGFMAPKPASAH